MPTANTSNDTVDAAKQALVKAKQSLAAAEQNRATAVVKATHSLDTAIAAIHDARGIADTAVNIQYTDGVSGAKQHIEVTIAWDEQVERAKKAVKTAKAALYLAEQLKQLELD